MTHFYQNLIKQTKPLIGTCLLFAFAHGALGASLFLPDGLLKRFKNSEIYYKSDDVGGTGRKAAGYQEKDHKNLITYDPKPKRYTYWYTSVSGERKTVEFQLANLVALTVDVEVKPIDKDFYGYIYRFKKRDGEQSLKNIILEISSNDYEILESSSQQDFFVIKVELTKRILLSPKTFAKPVGASFDLHIKSKNSPGIERIYSQGANYVPSIDDGEDWSMGLDGNSVVTRTIMPTNKKFSSLAELFVDAKQAAQKYQWVTPEQLDHLEKIALDTKRSERESVKDFKTYCSIEGLNEFSSLLYSLAEP